MRRREFIAGLGTVAGWPSSARAQQRQLPRIGLLGVHKGSFDGIVRSLAERGYVDGKTVVIEQRQAEGQLERLPALARELVSLPVDIIVSVPAAATVAARQATATIPIVMVHAGEAGLIGSLARPGGNVTGTTSYSPELVGKAVGLLRELVPAISRLAVLVVSSNIGTPLTVREAQLAATSLGMDLTVVGVDRAEDLDAAFATITRAGSDALLVPADPLHWVNRARLLGFEAQTRLPTIYGIADLARLGGLIGFGPVWPAHYPLAADYVDKILKGAKPSDLPVAQSTKFELVINLKTAKALGIAVPLSLQAQADEVIE
jgi:putative tryptophan/tyrosine transport system substrate-binding protein